MKRSGGVTASAIVAIAGSIVSILFGTLSVFSLVAVRGLPQPAGAPGGPVSPVNPALLVMFTVLVYFGFAAWGIVSAIGLLRLRNWARICFVVYGVLLAVSGFFGGLISLVMIRVFPQTLPPENQLSPQAITVLFGVFAAFALLFTGLGVFWAIFFNRRRVTEQFLQEGVSAVSRQFPLSIRIIAWFLIAGGAFSLPQLILASVPIMVFGIMLRGWAGRIVMILLVAVSLAAGTGLLRRRAEAHAVAVGYFVFTLLNIIVTFCTPGATSRMRQLLAELQPNQPALPLMDFIFPLAAAFGVLASGVLLWLLMRRRKSYLAVCEIQ